MWSQITHGETPTPLNSCAIVVPCFNEGSRLDPDLFAGFASSTHNVTFVFVDDGSTDNTPAMLRTLSLRSAGRVSILTLKSNCGKAEAVRTGMIAALRQGHTFCGFWDADLATPLSSVLTFAMRLEQNPEVALVMGSRIRLLGRKIERKWFRHYIGRIFATAASSVLGFAVYDTQCGAKLFRNCSAVQAVFDRPFVSRWLFDVELLLRMKRAFRDPDFSSTAIEEPLDEWRDVAGSKIRLNYFFVIPIALFAIWIRDRLAADGE